MTEVSTLENESTIDRLFGPVIEAQTYKNLVYLLLSFPLGTLYFVVLVTGFSIGLPMSLLFVGIPILLATFAVAHLFVRLERGLLGISVPPRPRAPAKGLIRQLSSWLDQPGTWKGLAWLFLRFPIGIVSLVIVTALVPLSLVLMTMPFTFRYIQTNPAIETSDQALVVCCAGAILWLLSVHVMNGWAALCRLAANALLR